MSDDMILRRDALLAIDTALRLNVPLREVRARIAAMTLADRPCLSCGKVGIGFGYCFDCRRNRDEEVG